MNGAQLEVIFVKEQQNIIGKDYIKEIHNLLLGLEARYTEEAQQFLKMIQLTVAIL